MDNNNFYNLGLVSISFRGHSPREILCAMKDAGLSCIEWGSDVHAPFDDAKKLNEIAVLQKEFGIVCSSYGTYFRLGYSKNEELVSYINAAKVLGTRVLRLWCGAKKGPDMTIEEKEHLFSECKKAAEIAEKNDVVLCMECHGITFTELSSDIVELMETVNSSHFRMYWQPFQWLTAKENLEFAKTIKQYTEHIHVFNWDKDGRYPLIDGVQDWKEYLSLFETSRTLLLEFMPDDRIETLATEADALKKIVGDLI